MIFQLSPSSNFSNRLSFGKGDVHMTETVNDKESIFSRWTIAEGIVGLGMVVLAFLAIAFSDVSGGRTQGYWTALVVIYAIAAYTVDQLYSGVSFRDVRRALSLALHWGGVFAAMLLVYYFTASGRFANANIGLANGLVLALGTFLYGVHGNWRFMVIGGALGLGTLGVAFTEEYLWILFGIVVLALIMFIVGSRIARSTRLPADM
jgi:hypothetical protein